MFSVGEICVDVMAQEGYERVARVYVGEWWGHGPQDDGKDVPVGTCVSRSMRTFVGRSGSRGVRKGSQGFGARVVGTCASRCR
jgi:hypothetical protein